eukprot:6176163-Pleurochrysis_carterae.AAC.1
MGLRFLDGTKLRGKPQCTCHLPAIYCKAFFSAAGNGRGDYGCAKLMSGAKAEAVFAYIATAGQLLLCARLHRYQQGREPF